jgi:hypothetical protein
MMIIATSTNTWTGSTKKWKVVMPSLQAAPLLIITIMGLLLGLLAWGVLLSQRHTSTRDFFETPDYLRLGLLLLAIFSLGVFVALALEVTILR